MLPVAVQNNAVLSHSKKDLLQVPEAVVRRKARLPERYNTYYAEAAAKLHHHFPQYSLPVLMQWCDTIDKVPHCEKSAQVLSTDSCWQNIHPVI